MTIAAARRPRLRALGAAAALALALAGVGARADRAAADTAACATGAPLGAAQGYDEFVLGDGTRGSESEGAVAYGGSLGPSGMTVGTRLTVPVDFPALVVGGTASGWFNLQRGSAYVHAQSGGGVNFNGGGHLLSSNPIDFAAAFADLRDRSARWAATAANGTAEVVDSDTTGTSLGGDVLLLHGTDAHLNVFSVTPSQLTGIRATFIDVPAGSTALIDVSGGDVTVNGEIRYRSGSTYVQADDSPVAGAVDRTIWNFADATSVKLDTGSAFGGTILAPNAYVQAISVGHDDGAVIAARFSSSFETHQYLVPSDACVPGGGGTPQPANVSIRKTASDATPHGGDTVTYTLTVHNAGPGTAEGVKATDAIPPGVTFDAASAGCSQSGGVVTCDAGDLAAGATKTFAITVIADPLAAVEPVRHPGSRHFVPVEHVEQPIDLDPGQTRTVTIACPSGQVMTDGSVRADAVDQGTGTLASVQVISGRTTGARTWQAVVRNDATGRAQAKAFGVCVVGRTSEDEGHAHALTVSDPVTVTKSLGAGRSTVTVACPDGTTPIVPGFAFAGGDARLAASEPASGGWRFDVDAAQPVTATLSLRCLDDTTAAADGHVHALPLTDLVKHVTLPAGQVVEAQVICADDAKGIVASWDLPPGLLERGNDARVKTRAFKLLNPTASDLTATVDLECLDDRTGGEQPGAPGSRTVVNTAHVTSTSTDPDPGDDADSATIVVSGNGAAVVGDHATVGHAAVALRSACPAGGSACAGTVSVAAAGHVVARGSFRVAPGHVRTLRVPLTSAGRRALRGHRRRAARATLHVRGEEAHHKRIVVRR